MCFKDSQVEKQHDSMKSQNKIVVGMKRISRKKIEKCKKTNIKTIKNLTAQHHMFNLTIKINTIAAYLRTKRISS